MQLIIQELYKIFRQKVIYIAIGVFIVLYALYFFVINEGVSSTSHHQIKYWYEQMGGNVTDEKIAWSNQILEQEQSRLAKNIKPDEEWLAKLRVANDIQSTLPAKNEYLKTKELLEQEVSRLSNSGNFGFEYKQAHTQLDIVQKVGFKDEVAFLEGWKDILRFMPQIGFYFLGGLTIIGLSNIFTQEYNNQMNSLIFSSKHGRKKIVIAKVAAAFLYCTIVTILFVLFVMAISGYYFGLNGWNASLNTMSTFYSSTSFAGDVWQFYALQLMYVIFGCTILGLLVIFLSSLTRSAMIPAFIAGMIFLLPQLLHLTQIPAGAISWLLAKIKYLDFIKMENLGSSNPSYKIFGNPLIYDQYILIMMLAYCSISLLFIFYSVKKRQVI